MGSLFALLTFIALQNILSHKQWSCQEVSGTGNPFLEGDGSPAGYGSYWVPGLLGCCALSCSDSFFHLPSVSCRYHHGLSPYWFDNAAWQRVAEAFRHFLVRIGNCLVGRYFRCPFLKFLFRNAVAFRDHGIPFADQVVQWPRNLGWQVKATFDFSRSTRLVTCAAFWCGSGKKFKSQELKEPGGPVES